MTPAQRPPDAPTAPTDTDRQTPARRATADAPSDYDALRAALAKDWRPRTATQCLLVDHLTRLHWQLLRVGEAGADRLAKLQDDRLGTDRPEAALAWDLCRQQSSLHRIQLFQTRLERSIAQAIGLLQTLQKPRSRRATSRRAP